MSATAIINAIDESPLNRGLRGVDWVADSRNVPIVHGDDIALFDYESPGIFQIHVLFESSRGRGAVERVNDALDAMFRDHGAEIIFALVPDFRRDVKMMARWTGFHYAGKRSTDCGICELFTITKAQWQKGHSQ